MDNPNEYNDAAFTEASSRLTYGVSELLDAAWKAGAGLEDIADDLTTAFENCASAELSGSGLSVKVVEPDGE